MWQIFLAAALIAFALPRASAEGTNSTTGDCSPIVNGDNNSIFCPQVDQFALSHSHSVHVLYFGKEVYPGVKLEANYSILDGYEEGQGEADSIRDLEIYAIEGDEIVRIYQTNGIFLIDFKDNHKYGVKFALPREPVIILTCLIFNIPKENNNTAMSIEAHLIHLPENQVHASDITPITQKAILRYRPEANCETLTRVYALENRLFGEIAR